MMKNTRLVAILGSLLFAATCIAESVELNVVQSDRASFGAAQDWVRALGSLRSVRVTSDSRKPARPEAKWVGSTLFVTGVIGAQDELVVPGKKFSIRQTKALQAWIDAQKTSRTSEGTEAKDQKFGLTVSELERVHELLKSEVTISTKDVPTTNLLRSVVRSSALPLQIDSSVLQRLGDAKSVSQWEGYSVGTVLAALLRPHEMVVVPRVVGGRIELLVKSERATKEGWPVGWEPKLKKHELVPKLFDTLPIEIYNTPIRDVMAAIEGRIETPILFDEGMLAAAKMDPNTINVTINSKRTFYGKVIRKALFDAKMTSKILTDEQGKPFFWVTPVVVTSKR